MFFFFSDERICVFDDEKLTKELQNQLRMIRHDYEITEQAAQKKIADLKRHNSLNTEFEKEFESFQNSYRVVMNVMKLKPSFCERLIEELADAIKHFHQLATS